eukprot:9414725-Pyramimonas_sp.AAC.1
MQQQFDQLQVQGPNLDDEWKKLFLEAGVSLEDSAHQMLRAMTRNDSSFQGLQAAIREMDMSRNEYLSAAGNKKTYLE